MKRRRKNIIIAVIIVAVIAFITIYIKFFNGSLIYISMGMGNNVVLKAKTQQTSMMEADILLSDARAEYENVFGSDVWSQTIDGVSFEEYVKDQVKTKLIRVRCMNLYAKQRGVVLSRTQKEAVSNAVTEYMSKLSDDQKNALNITEEKLNTMFTDFAIADALFGDVTASVNKEISDDDARVINVQYVAASTEEDIKAAQAELNSGVIFYVVASKYNDGGEYESELKRGETDENFEKAAFDLKNGEVSSIVEAEGKYYIIKCVSDNEKSKTEANKATLIEKNKLDYFNEQFADFESSVYVEFNNRVWKNKQVKNSTLLDVNFENIFDSVKE